MDSQNKMNRFRLDENKRIGAGFTPDETYFDKMQMDVMQKLRSEQRVVPLYRRLWIPAVAALLLIALMLTFNFNTSAPESVADTSSIENYLAYNTAVAQYEIAAQLTDADIDILEAELSADQNAIENFLYDNPNLEQYLINYEQ